METSLLVKSGDTNSTPVQSGAQTTESSLDSHTLFPHPVTSRKGGDVGVASSAAVGASVGALLIRFSVLLSVGEAVIASGTKTGRKVGEGVSTTTGSLVGRRVGDSVTFLAVGGGVGGCLVGGSVFSNCTSDLL